MRKMYSIIITLSLVSFLGLNGVFGQSGDVQFSPSSKSVGASKGSLTVGIKENIKAQSVNIFSYTNKIFINIDNANSINGEVVVYDLLGKEILKTKIEDSSSKLSIENKIPGFYIVKTRINNKDYVKKLFVE